MKNTKIILILFSLALILPLYANEKELFPLREVKLGDSAEKLRANYPVAYHATNASGEEVFLIPIIKDNKYWKEAWICAREGKIVFKRYLSAAYLSRPTVFMEDKDEEAKKSVREIEAEVKKGKGSLPLILKDLFAVLGKNFDFGLEKSMFSKKSAFFTVLIWERDNYYVSFTHFGYSLIDYEIKPSDSSPLTLDTATLVLTETKKESFDECHKLSKDKKVTEELKKEWDAYFSSLEE